MTVTQEQYENVQRAGSVVKLVCGMANNVCGLMIQEAMEHVRQLPQYRHGVKAAYGRALKEWRDYERGLLHPIHGVRFFHMGDMKAENRKKYGDISDRDYYDFWCGLAGPAYKKTRPFVTALVHKYRLSMERHGMAHAEHVAWAVTALVLIEIAGQLYETTLREVCGGYGLPRQLVDYTFKAFCLKDVADAWEAALVLTDKTEFKLTELETKNIDVSQAQLFDMLADPNLMYDSAQGACVDFEEIFRTKGECRKAQRKIAEIKNKVV